MSSQTVSDVKTKANWLGNFVTWVEYGRGIYGSLEPDARMGSKIREIRKKIDPSPKTETAAVVYGIMCAFIGLCLVAALVLTVSAKDACLEGGEASCSEPSSLGYFSLFMVILWMAFPLILHWWQLSTRKGVLDWISVKQVILIDVMYCYIFAMVVVSVKGGMWEGLNALGFGNMAGSYFFAGPLLLVMFGKRAMLPPGMPREEYRAHENDLSDASMQQRQEISALLSHKEWKKRSRSGLRIVLLFSVIAILLLCVDNVIWGASQSEVRTRWQSWAIALTVAPGLELGLVRVFATRKIVNLSKGREQEME